MIKWFKTLRSAYWTNVVEGVERYPETFICGMWYGFFGTIWIPAVIWWAVS